MKGPGHSAFMLGVGDPTRKAAAHDVELGYTTDDDGIWLSCACGWEQLLGFSATPEEAIELVNEHRFLAASPPAARSTPPPESPR